MVHEFSHVSIGTKDVAYGCLVGGSSLRVRHFPKGRPLSCLPRSRDSPCSMRIVTAAGPRTRISGLDRKRAAWTRCPPGLRRSRLPPSVVGSPGFQGACNSPRVSVAGDAEIPLKRSVTGQLLRYAAEPLVLSYQIEDSEVASLAAEPRPAGAPPPREGRPGTSACLRNLIRQLEVRPKLRDAVREVLCGHSEITDCPGLRLRTSCRPLG